MISHRPRRLGGAGLVVGLVMMGGPAGAEPRWRTPGSDQATEARQHAAEGRCREAIGLFDAAIEQRQDDAELRRDRGRCHDREGNIAPASEDYRTYLSMAPHAPDTAAITERLDALDAQDTATAPTPPPPDPATGSTPNGADRVPEAHLPASGALVGVHVGGRKWDDGGFIDPTLSLGLAASLVFTTELEAFGRVLYLDSGNSGDGWGLGAGAKWRLPLEARWELTASLSGGFERQTTELRQDRDFWFGRVTPAARWAFSPGVLLEMGPEFGFGGLPRPAQNIEEPDETRFSFYFGVAAEVLWQLGG